MVRYPHINGHVTSGIQSTTGVPEGCSISVLAMLATSSLYYYRLYHQYIRPFAFADNWSWMTLQQKEHVIAYQKVVHLADTMRLQIDHRKSWHWGTGKDGIKEVEESSHNWLEKIVVHLCQEPWRIGAL